MTLGIEEFNIKLVNRNFRGYEINVDNWGVKGDRYTDTTTRYFQIANGANFAQILYIHHNNETIYISKYLSIYNEQQTIVNIVGDTLMWVHQTSPTVGLEMKKGPIKVSLPITYKFDSDTTFNSIPQNEYPTISPKH